MELKNPNSQGPSDLQESIQPRVVYPEKTSMEFQGMDINVGAPRPNEVPNDNSYIGPTPAPRQNVPSMGSDFLGSIANSIIPSASAGEPDARSAMLERVKSSDVASKPTGVETKFTVSEKDVLGDEEFTKTRFGFGSKLGKSGIEGSAGKTYDLKITDDGGVFYKRGKANDWRPISSDPVISKAFEKRMAFIGTLIDTPAMAAGAFAVPAATAIGPASVGAFLGESAAASSAIGRMGVAATGNALTQASSLGQKFAASVEDPVLVDYFMKHKGKTSPVVSGVLEAAGQGAAEIVSGFFGSAAKTNRAYSKSAKQIEEAAGRVPPGGDIDGGSAFNMTPGQSALGTPFGSEIVDLELEAAQDPAVRSYLINRNIQQAKQLDEAVNILKSRYQLSSTPGSSIKKLTTTPGGNVENFLERDLRAAGQNIKRNREDLYYAVPNLKNKQIINPRGILAIIEDTLADNFGEAIFRNGQISEALVKQELMTGSGAAFEGEKDLLKLYLETKRMVDRGGGPGGLSEDISTSVKSVFDGSPEITDVNSEIQQSMSIPRQDNLFLKRNPSENPIENLVPRRGVVNRSTTPEYPLGSEQITQGQHIQPNLVGNSMSVDMPKELKSIAAFKASIGGAAKGLDDADIMAAFFQEKAKYINARSYLPNGAPGVQREANLTLPQFSSIVDRAQKLGAFESAISSKTPAQKSSAEMAGILRHMEDDVMTDLAIKNGRTDLAQRIIEDKAKYSSRFNRLTKVKKALDTDFLTKTFLNLPTSEAELLISAMSKENKSELQVEVLNDLFKKAHFNKKMYTIGKDGQYEGFDRGKFFKETMNDPRTSKNMETLFGKDALKEIVDLGKIAEKIDLYGPVLEQKTKDLMLGQLQSRGYRIASALFKSGSGTTGKTMRVLDAVFKTILPQTSEDLADRSRGVLSNIARKLYEAEMMEGKKVTASSIKEVMKTTSESAAKKAIMQERAAKTIKSAAPAVIKTIRIGF